MKKEEKTVMINETQKILNEDITPFWEHYISYAREASEQRDEDETLIIKFVDRYNKQFIPLKFQFKENIENCYVWSYEKDSIDLKVTILNVAKAAVILKCERNGKVKEIELMEPPYADIYNTVYKFLIDTVENVITLAEAEAKMKF